MHMHCGRLTAPCQMACGKMQKFFGDKTMAKVSFLGLGVMGYPMAGHQLKKGGHEVTVYNRSPAKAAQWVKEHGGKSAPSPREAAQGADFVLMCVGNDDDVRAVAYGDNGVLTGLKKGAILVDHTTASSTGRAPESAPGLSIRSASSSASSVSSRCATAASRRTRTASSSPARWPICSSSATTCSEFQGRNASRNRKEAGNRAKSRGTFVRFVSNSPS